MPPWNHNMPGASCFNTIFILQYNLNSNINPPKWAIKQSSRNIYILNTHEVEKLVETPCFKQRVRLPMLVFFNSVLSVALWSWSSLGF
jgi:hypothetical protein